eukprot:5704638-Pyramimonas_sp.AAC.2
MKAMLNRMGAECTVVDDGQQAITAMKNSPDAFDCILMDCNMPMIDGCSATRAIRALEAARAGAEGPGGSTFRKRIPIIGVTGNRRRGDKRKCLVAGMDDYISKPAGIRTHMQKLIKWTHLVQVRDAPAPRGTRRSCGSRTRGAVRGAGVLCGYVLAV